MKILFLSSYDDRYLNFFYKNNKQLQTASFNEQLQAIYHDSYAWADGFKLALQEKGVQSSDIVVNARYMQLSWARERKLKNFSAHSIVLNQICEYSPDVLFFNCYDTSLLASIKADIKSIKLLIGHSGSAIVNREIFDRFDLVISCAPEVVCKLKDEGINAEQLHHAFDPRIKNRVSSDIGHDDFKEDIIFIGQIVPGKQFHNIRNDFLKEMSQSCDLSIYCSNLSETNLLKLCLQRSLVNYFSLKRNLKNGVFGLDMYRTIGNAKIVLNVHADSSFQFASNMRLFETTGMGACLLTDWKENINDLFIDGKECITYKSAQDAVEKASWLLKHPDICKEIAKSGQEKTLQSHTFEHRTDELLQIIARNL